MKIAQCKFLLGIEVLDQKFKKNKVLCRRGVKKWKIEERKFENGIIEHFLPTGMQGTDEQLKLEVLKTE